MGYRARHGRPGPAVIFQPKRLARMQYGGKAITTSVSGGDCDGSRVHIPGSIRSMKRRRRVRPQPLLRAVQEPLFSVALAFALGILAANFLWRVSQRVARRVPVAALRAAAFFRRQLNAWLSLGATGRRPPRRLYLQSWDAAQTTSGKIFNSFATGENAVEADGTRHSRRPRARQPVRRQGRNPLTWKPTSFRLGEHASSIPQLGFA